MLSTSIVSSMFGNGYLLASVISFSKNASTENCNFLSSSVTMNIEKHQGDEQGVLLFCNMPATLFLATLYNFFWMFAKLLKNPFHFLDYSSYTTNTLIGLKTWMYHDVRLPSRRVSLRNAFCGLRTYPQSSSNTRSLCPMRASEEHSSSNSPPVCSTEPSITENPLLYLVLDIDSLCFRAAKLRKGRYSILSKL